MLPRIQRWTTGIRASTVLSAIVTLTIALVVGALILRSQLRDSLYSSISDQAMTRATGVAQLVSTGDFEPTLQASGALPGWVQVIDSNGTIVASTANIATLKTPFAPVLALRTPSMRALSGLAIDEGERLAVASIGASHQSTNYTVLAAVPLDIADVADARVARVLLIVFPTLLILAAFLVSTVLRRALRPVENIRKQVATISSSDLSRRVPVPAGNDEISRLAITMNSMLGRLEHSADQQRSFVADASHELRSPFASLRSQLEVSTIDNSNQIWKETVDNMLIDHDRLERLVSDLLLLTRTDSKEALVLEPIDLGYLVRHELSRRLIPTGQIRSIDCPNLLISGDQDALIRVLRNLVDNAERHAQTSVHVGVTSIGAASVSLIVHDDGPGIPCGQEHRIFERFVRLDDARTSDAGGSGLGLAIVAELADAQHGTVVVDPKSSGARFVVTFPKLVM